MSENTEREAQPPYISFTTVKNFVVSLRGTGLPNRIDRSLIIGQSGGTQSYMLSAMRFFGLMDANQKPTERLGRFVNEPEAETKIWEEAVREGYGFLFSDGFNHETATDSELADKFKDKGLNGATIRKCMSCFASACEAAGIKTSPHLKAGKRQTGGGVRTARRAGKKRQNGGSQGGEQEQTPPPPSHHAPHGASVSKLLLNPTGTRYIKLESPATVTSSELKRIQQWLSFQLIVTDVSVDEDDDLK